MKMEKNNERRNEQRLIYRWPVRFVIHPEPENAESNHAQMFDLSSIAMTFLCDSDGNCPQKEQQITVNFSTPYFNNNTFDTVFFERKGKVYRIEKMSDRVNRITVDFNEPLFFKPGEQQINPSEAEQRLQNQAISIIKAEEKAKAYSRALSEAEEQSRFFAQAKAKLEQMLHIEIENRAKFEADLRLKTQQEILNHIEAAAKAQEIAKAEAKAREIVEKKAEAEAEKMAKALLDEKILIYNQQIAAIKSDFEKTIAEMTQYVEESISLIEAKYQQDGYNPTTVKSVHRKKKMMLQKLDKFIKDTNRFF
jgi:hypothetical protein